MASTSRSAYFPRPLFGKSMLAPALRDITVDNVLAGDTCSPIGLSDFEAYLSFVENSLENLQFVVWFNHYRSRYPSAPATSEQTSSATVEAALSSLSPLTSASSYGMDSKTGYGLDSQTSTAPFLPKATQSGAGRGGRPPQPGRAELEAECARVVATFLQPGTSKSATKELALDADARERVLRGLLNSTHPDVFLPAYDAAYRSLQGSLGRFLDASKHAINSPKQRFLYMLGSFWFVCGLILFVAATIAPPHSLTHSGTSIFRARLLRLAAIPFLFQGALQLGSASRGFCLRVGSRGRTQLRSWELAHATAETQAWWINVVSDPPRGVLDTDVDDVGDGSPRTARDLEAAISPDTAASAVRHAARERARLLAELEQISPFAQPGTVEMSSLERPHGSHSPLASPTSPRSPRSPLSPPPTSGALLPSPSSASVRGRPGQPIAIEVGPARRNTLDIASIKHFSYGSAIDSIDGEVYRPEPMPTKTGLVHDYPPTPDAYTAPPTRRPRTRSSNGYRTPPVFGPERVVLDPRVQAMHLRIWREIFGTAIIIGLVSIVLACLIPVMHAA